MHIENMSQNSIPTDDDLLKSLLKLRIEEHIPIPSKKLKNIPIEEILQSFPCDL